MSPRLDPAVPAQQTLWMQTDLSTRRNTDLYKYSPDAVPPIHAVSYHVATDKPPPVKNGDKFRSIFSDNLQPIATRRKKARGTLLVDQHCGNGCSIKRAPLSVSYYNEINGGHIGQGVVRRGGVLPAQYCPCGSEARCQMAKGTWPT